MRKIYINAYISFAIILVVGIAATVFIMRVIHSVNDEYLAELGAP